MPDLNIVQGDLERFSAELGEVSNGRINLHGSSPETHTGPISHAWRLLLQAGAIRGRTHGGPADGTEDFLHNPIRQCGAAANQFKATEEINQQAIQQVRGSIPEPCPPVGPSKGE